MSGAGMPEPSRIHRKPGEGAAPGMGHMQGVRYLGYNSSVEAARNQAVQLA